MKGWAQVTRQAICPECLRFSGQQARGFFLFFPKRVVLNYVCMYTWMQVPVEARSGCQLPCSYR